MSMDWRASCLTDVALKFRRGSAYVAEDVAASDPVQVLTIVRDEFGVPKMFGNVEWHEAFALLMFVLNQRHREVLKG